MTHQLNLARNSAGPNQKDDIGHKPGSSNHASIVRDGGGEAPSNKGSSEQKGAQLSWSQRFRRKLMRPLELLHLTTPKSFSRQDSPKGGAFARRSRSKGSPILPSAQSPNMARAYAAAKAAFRGSSLPQGGAFPPPDEVEGSDLSILNSSPSQNWRRAEEALRMSSQRPLGRGSVGTAVGRPSSALSLARGSLKRDSVKDQNSRGLMDDPRFADAPSSPSKGKSSTLRRRLAARQRKGQGVGSPRRGGGGLQEGEMRHTAAAASLLSRMGTAEGGTGSGVDQPWTGNLSLPARMRGGGRGVGGSVSAASGTSTEAEEEGEGDEGYESSAAAAAAASGSEPATPGSRPAGRPVSVFSGSTECSPLNSFCHGSDVVSVREGEPGLSFDGIGLEERPVEGVEIMPVIDEEMSLRVPLSSYILRGTRDTREEDLHSSEARVRSAIGGDGKVAGAIYCLDEEKPPSEVGVALEGGFWSVKEPTEVDPLEARRRNRSAFANEIGGGLGGSTVAPNTAPVSASSAMMASKAPGPAAAATAQVRRSFSSNHATGGLGGVSALDVTTTSVAGGGDGGVGQAGGSNSPSWGVRLMRVMSGRRSTDSDLKDILTFPRTSDGHQQQQQDGQRDNGRPGGTRPALQRYSLGLFGGTAKSPTASSSANTAQQQTAFSTKGNKAEAIKAEAIKAEATSATVPSTKPSKARRLLSTLSMPVQPKPPAPTPVLIGGRPKPNLMRQACYSGLVGTYRSGGINPQTTAEGSASNETPGGMFPPSTAAGGSSKSISEADRRQLDELKGWLVDTSAPWRHHSDRMIQQGIIEEDEADGQGDKVGELSVGGGGGASSGSGSGRPSKPPRILTTMSLARSKNL